MAARKTAAAPEVVAHASLGEALLAFQAEKPAISKDSKNPHFSSTYAGLETIMQAVNPVLQKHGLALIAVLDQSSIGTPALRTVLMHPASDQMIEGVCPMPEGNLKNAQQMGSATTYFRRYGVLAILGLVAGADDDGNAASAVETRTTVTVPSQEVPGATITVEGPATPAVLPAAPNDAAGIGGALVL